MENITLLNVKDQEQAAQQVCKMIQGQLDEGKLDVLGLATGSTMIPIYKKWVESELSFEKVTTFNLDEYVGLHAENKNSYAYFMQEHLFSKKKFKRSFIPNGVANNLEEECAAYEKRLREYPLDVQLLGIGENGHIAFNEPGTSFDSVTHLTTLTESTLGVNSTFFDPDETIPRTALTMGISSVLAAKKIILIAFGERKRFALEKLLEGKETVEYPVTALNGHGDVTVITDLGYLI
ncbi:glucosamine-6-phosphate deaminase [Sporosarcina soli]|uniref:Glucosamine-6-phosphate deaminase n=1 Tax=Sporosarcina soli TaxID=334736 RepID=A0ABW0TJZ9_9BACL